MNTQANDFIRQADSSDAESLAKLINLAGEGIPNWLWTRACVEGQTPLEIGIERAKRKTGGFSYTNALVAESGGNPIGMVLSYAITQVPTENPDDLPAPIAPFVALEKLSANTWFINALAVFAEAQNQSVGSQLLAAAENLACSNGFDKMSIQVYAQNTGAVRLYARHGYKQVASDPVRLHPSPPYYTGDVLLLMKSLSGAAT
ncbi:GNAT family N-acetyltransferase [Ruegeria sp. 2205SS24-7]|uniref:GNAT family N-acetyltransferase n=1 Tax=Ruegeria discodermiae TaxID=3064389 RepID=UPI002741055C|nr:GNAT family N-acetyltransferase [Ruegeria sp. 2205SS24-7]MDP5219849.1 GNAT family N-acetyltransferase [Ruegeria sp. 2205SS24-7]